MGRSAKMHKRIVSDVSSNLFVEYVVFIGKHYAAKEDNVAADI